jgi:hypothetical protein
MAVFQTPEEREQIASLKTHQKTVKAHKSAKKRVDAIAEALSDAQQDHQLTAAERAEAKENLVAVLEDL